MVVSLSLLVSCAMNNGRIRVINNDGKKTNVKTQVPRFNKDYLEKQSYREQNKHYTQNVNNSIKIDNNVQNEHKKIIDSTAYSNESVIDKKLEIQNTIEKNREIRKNSIEEIKKVEENEKTIKDFEYLPDSVFADEVQEERNIPEKTNNNEIKKEERQEIKKDIEQKTNNEVKQGIKEENEQKIEEENKQEEKKGFFAFFTNRKSIKKSNEAVQNNDNEGGFFSFFKRQNKVKKETIKENITENETVYEISSDRNDFLNGGKKEETKETPKNQVKSSDNLKKNKLEVGSIKTDDSKKISEKYKHKNNVNYKKQDKKVVVLNNNLNKDKYYLQLGSFKNEKEANELLNKYKLQNQKGSIIKVDIPGKGLYHRVVLGEFDNKNTAELEKERIINLGHYDVFIFKE